MNRVRLSCLFLLLCLFCAVPLSAAENAKVSAVAFQFAIDGDQALGALAPALEKFAKGKAALAEADKLLKWAKGWGYVAKFFGGGLDCLNALKNGWDIGSAINGCISAFQKNDFSEFTKQFNGFARSTVKGVVAITTTALLTSISTAGAPVLVLVGTGFAIGVTTDYLVSKIDLKKPLEWARDTWDSFRNKKAPPPLLVVVGLGARDPDTGPRSPGGKRPRPPSPPVKIQKHQVH